MTIEELKARKIELGYTSEMIAEKSGVPLSTVQKIFSGATKAPRKLTLDAIISVLQDEKKNIYGSRTSRGYGETGFVRNASGEAGFGRKGSQAAEAGAASSGMLRESSWNYNAVPKDDIHTLEDYYALPDDLRAELIDGKFYVMEAPSLEHQGLLVQLAILFCGCAEEHGMDQCTVYVAPCDVHLDMDNYTMVQPDLMVICGDHDNLAKRYEGAPDLIVEILSNFTRSKDMVLKLYKYHRAGVREYWIVDPKHKEVTVHFFGEDEYNPEQYTFDDVIPVRISDGKCSIDFLKIRKKLYR